MKVSKKIMVMGFAVLLLGVSAALAVDYDWMKDLNIKAEADPTGFKARVAARFKIGNSDVNMVMSNVGKPAEAYMVLRLGEISHQPTDYVIKEYRSNKGKGWGVLAKSLGIKPGSKEFHALKRGHDLDRRDDDSKGKGKGRGKGHNK